jgi:hypothetical protein
VKRVDTARDLVRFKCPFCKGDASAVETASGIPGVMHTMPTCEKFDELEPDDYLHAVNARMLS